MTTWGAWEDAGSNGMRVGIDITVENVTGHFQSGCTFTVDYWTENRFSYGDTQTLNLGGTIGGSVQFTNNDGGTAVKRLTRTYVYLYKAGEYGPSPGKLTFSANVAGTYNGVTPSASATAAIDGRPYGVPAPPTAVSLSRISDDTAKVTWVNHPTAGEPYSGHTVQRWIYGFSDDWATMANPDAGATTFSGAIAPNRRYAYQVRANNSVGSSAFVQTKQDIWTTPAAPTVGARTEAGTTQTINWTNNVAYAAYATQVWHAANGVWDSAALTTVASGVTSYAHAGASTSIKHSYRLRAVTTLAPKVLYSAYSAVSTESAGTTSAPGAPTGLSPSSDQTFDPAGPIPMSWTHNPTDGSAQTQFQIRHRVVGAGTWTTMSVVTSPTSSYTLAAGTYGNGLQVEWQVMTWGAGSTGSAFSASATFKTAAAVIVKLPVYLNPVSGMLEASQTPAGGGGGGTGPPGTPATVTIASTTTLAPGSAATVTDSDPDPSIAALNFGIPRGDVGPAGSSAALSQPVNGAIMGFPGIPDQTTVISTPWPAGWTPGDLDIRALVAPTNWAPAGTKTQFIIGTYDPATTPTGISWSMQISATGKLTFMHSVDGVTAVADQSVASIPGTAPNVALWLRITYVASTGLITYYTSTDGTTWTSYETKTTATVGAPKVSTLPVWAGLRNSATSGNMLPLSGLLYLAEVRDGIGGTVKAQVDFRGQWTGTGSAGNVWTIAGKPYWYLPAGTGPQGIQGIQGVPGSKWYSAAGAPAGASYTVGDWYLDSATGDYYEKTSAAAWTLRGNLKGPQGIQGIQGIQGNQGTAGTAGTAGTPGEKWSTGAGAPTGVTPGALNDWYLDSTAGDYYEKTGISAWTLRGNLKGPTGTAGTPATVSVASTTTLAPGSAATVTDSDASASVAALNFGIPRGDVGAKGDKGDKGDTGNTGADGALAMATSLASGTTDGVTAAITFPHALGVVPKVWQAWAVDSGGTGALNFLAPTTATTTTCSFIVHGSGGNLRNGVAVSVHLVVYK